MKLKYMTLIVFLSFQAICFGQFRPVTVKTNVNPAGVYSFMVQNTSPIPYYIVIYLTNAENIKASKSLPYIGISRPNTTLNNLFSISRKDKSKSCSFNYSYRYLYGSPRAKHNNKINYLIPFKDIGATKVSQVRNFSETMGHESPDSWNCFSFIASHGDTVYAARRGTVLEVKDKFEIADTSPFYTIERNSVLMVHKDGTLSRYSLFQKNGIFVQPGDEVFAGDPIGKVGGTSNQSVGKIWLMIFQYNSKNFKLNTSAQNISMTGIDRMTDKDNSDKWIYINPNFITSSGIVKLEENGIYESVYTTEAKQQELSKREIKRLLKKKLD